MKLSDLREEVACFSKSKRFGEPWCEDLQEKVLNYLDAHRPSCTVKSLARDLGIAPYLVYKWRGSRQKSRAQVQLIKVMKDCPIRFSLVWGELRVEYGGNRVS
jgi:hypothetical protein